MMTKHWLWIWTAVGCTGGATVPEPVEPSFIEVTLDSAPGTETDPLPFSADPHRIQVSLQTLDRNADPITFDGDLKVKVRPGRMEMDPWVTVSGGQWSGDVDISAAFGSTRVWFTDEGDKNAETGRPASWATAVTDPLLFALPTIHEMQETDDIEHNQLEREHVVIRTEDRQVVVTAVGTRGYWVSDLLDAPGNYSGLFIYTFNKPDEVYIGARITLLTGGNQEYLGATQLSFPAYEVEADSAFDAPDAVDISADTVCDDAAMETLESSLVSATNVEIPSEFTVGSDDHTDFLDYGQWPVRFSSTGCTFYVTSAATVPGFYPPDHAGETLSLLQGMLGYVDSAGGKWIIVTRGTDDIPDADQLQPEGPPPARPSWPIGVENPGHHLNHRH